MVGANLHGGLVLGAFLPDGEAVAMSFAFLGRIEGRLCLYSQLTGVVPGYQSQGLGYRIKMHQRDIARAEGIGVHRLGIRPAPGGQRPLQPGAAGRIGRPLHRKHVRRADRRAQRGRPHRPPHRRVGHARESDRRDAIPADARSVLPRLIDTTAGQRGESDVDAMPLPLGIEPGDRCSQRCCWRSPRDIARLRRERPELAEQWRATSGRRSGRLSTPVIVPSQFVRDETDAPRRGFYVLELRESDPMHPPKKPV